MKKLFLAIVMMAGPVLAQSNQDFVLRYTGFLGDLRLGPDQLRADLVNGDDDMAQVAIALDDTATAAFAQFTRTHINQQVTMFICGQTVATPVVQAEIDTGFSISAPVERDLAEAMVDALNGLADCPN